MSADADPAVDASEVVFDTDISPRNIRGLYVGVTGNVTVITSKNNTRTFVNVQGGTVLPIRVRQVLSSSAGAASDYLALY